MNFPEYRVDLRSCKVIRIDLFQTVIGNGTTHRSKKIMPVLQGKKEIIKGGNGNIRNPFQFAEIGIEKGRLTHIHRLVWTESRQNWYFKTIFFYFLVVFQ